MSALPPNRIQAYRLARHWTREDLAHRVGVTPKTVYRWELGLREPSLSAIHALVAAFGLSFSALFPPPLPPDTEYRRPEVPRPR